MSWRETLNEWVLAGVDGYVAVETAKSRAEQTPPTPAPDRDPAMTDAENGRAEPMVLGFPQSQVLLFFGGLLAVGLLLRGSR